jgi:hypothetical protein
MFHCPNKSNHVSSSHSRVVKKPLLCNAGCMSGQAEIVLAAINAKWIHPSLALRLLKANLGPLENRCQILEFAPRQDPGEQCSAILCSGCLILGLSVSIWNHLASLSLLELLEQAWKENRPFVVLGGSEVSALPEDAAIFDHADFIIRGEGELAFAELCESLLEGGRPPASALAGSPVRQRVPAPPVLPRAARFIGAKRPEPAVLDTAYRLYSDEDLSCKLIYAETSRGCPFACVFCQSSLNGGVREFPLDKFFTDMNILLERIKKLPPKKNGRPWTIKFLDRSFNASVPRALAVMDFFLSRLPEIPRLQLHFEMVPSLMPQKLAEAIARFPPGTLRLELGIQSLDPDVRALSGRFSCAGTELENLRLLRSTNAIIHADLIAGLPGETWASFGSGFDQLWAALSSAGKNPFEIQPGILKGLPGTLLRRREAEFGIRYSPRPPYEVLETPAMSSAELDRIKNFARFWELVVNRPSFPDMIPRLVLPGVPVFRRFEELSLRLFRRFGRNWGIDRSKIRAALETESL